ncbi:MAG: RidA family protein [Actinobacteria bacterium]|nr:RidA family protein [Actinomycetota bacterium]
MKQAVQGTTPAGAYSPGVIAEGRFVFVSGQASLRDGAVVSGTVEEETRLALANLGAVLAEAGAGLEDVVRVGVYLADIEDFAAMNAVYAELMPAPLPARTTIGADLPGIKVEIECVAVLAEGGG